MIGGYRRGGETRRPRRRPAARRARAPGASAALRRPRRQRLHGDDARRARAALEPLRRSRSPFARGSRRGRSIAWRPSCSRRSSSGVDAQGLVRPPSFKGLRTTSRPRRRVEGEGGPARRGGGVGGRDSPLQPRQAAVPAGGLHEGRPDRLLRRDRADAAAPPARAAPDRASAGRTASRAKPSTRRSAEAPSRLGRDGLCLHPQRRAQTDRLQASRRTWRRSRGSATRRRSSCTRRCARATDPDRPTARRLRPRPGPAGRSGASAREVALVLHGLFERLGLVSVVKTPAAKGLQVYLPLGEGVARVRRTKPFAQRVATLLEQQLPELVVSRMAKRLRVGQGARRLEPERPAQDDRRRLLRARAPTPAVSTPIAWEELRAAHDAGEAEGARVRPGRRARARRRARRRVRALAERAAGAAGAVKQRDRTATGARTRRHPSRMPPTWIP